MVVKHVCHKRQVGSYPLSGPFAFHAFKSTAGRTRFQCTSNAHSVQVQRKCSAVVMQSREERRALNGNCSRSDRQYGMCVAGRFRPSDVPFAATWKSACGWVAAWHQKSALAPVAGDTVASRRCFSAGVGVGQGVIRRASTCFGFWRTRRVLTALIAAGRSCSVRPQSCSVSRRKIDSPGLGPRNVPSGP